MKVKFKQPIKATLIFTYDETYNIFDEWVTNSQDRLWEFLNSYQEKLDQRYEPEPGEVDDWGEEITKEPLFTPEIMGLIVQGQDNFNKKLGHLKFELVDIGVFGFIFIALPNKMDDVLEAFFDGELSQTFDENYELKEFIV